MWSNAFASQELSRDVSKQSALQIGHEIGTKEEGRAIGSAEHQSVNNSHGHVHEEGHSISR